MNWQDGVTYAHAVAKGEINVCNDVCLACQRFINQLENKEWEWVFDHRVPDHVLKFAGTLQHTKGPQAGEAVLLEPFQILLICATYGFRSKKDLNKRMVTDVILFIPRKAGNRPLPRCCVYTNYCAVKVDLRFTHWRQTESKPRLCLMLPRVLWKTCPAT